MYIYMLLICSLCGVKALPTSENTYSSCSFTTDMCGWVQDNTDHFNWTRHNGSTPTSNTGPSTDHTQGVQGYYAFIESSSPRKENDSARLISQTISHLRSDCCFDIWYHMFGGNRQTATVGWLNVYVKPADVSLGTLSPIFSKHGNQGDKWILGRIQIPTLSENFQIIIEAIRGTFYSDIAIDDLTFWDCQKSTTSTTISLTTTSPPSTALPHVTTSPSTTPLIPSSTLSSQKSSLPLTTRYPTGAPQESTTMGIESTVMTTQSTDLIPSSTLSSQKSSLPLATSYPTGAPQESTTMGIESTVMTTQSTDFTTDNEIAGKITTGNKENNEMTTKYLCESNKNCVKRGKTEASSEGSTQNVDLIPIIIGVSLGGVATVILLGLIMWLFMRKRHNRGEVKPEEESMRPIISEHRGSLTNEIENKNCTQSTNSGKSNPVCITNNLYMAVP